MILSQNTLSYVIQIKGRCKEDVNMGRKSGDSWENFIGEMYRRYYDRLMIVACSYTHDRTKAEDLVQEAFLKAILSYRKGGSFLSWACRVIRNSFLDQYRREKRFPEEDIDGEAEIPAQEDLLADYIKGEERRRLAAMISALPLKYRDVMIQSVYLEKTDAELARMYDTTEANVRQMRSRAKKMLVAMREEDDGYEEDR